MKKLKFIFNQQTLLVVILSLISAFISLKFKLSINIDYIFLGLFIVFPLTFSLRESFRRREKAIEYLCTYSASLQSSFHHFQNSKQSAEKKYQFKNILNNISTKLLNYLSGKTNNTEEVQIASDAVFVFLRENSEVIKRSFSEKILSHQFRINESILFLLAVKRHHTPWGVKAIILFAIYAFVIFYPASLLNSTGYDVPLWYVFVMTAFKSFILISLFNVQVQLEDSFNQKSADAIQIHEFECNEIINRLEKVEVIKIVKKPATKDSNIAKVSEKQDDEDTDNDDE